MFENSPSRPNRLLHAARNKALLVIALISCIGLATGGCVEFYYCLTGGPPGNDNSSSGGGSNTNGNSNENDNISLPVPRVELTASNPAPQPFEEVQLRCQVTNAPTSGVIYRFFPDTVLITSPTSSNASFIVDESFVGSSFAFTCTATNESGTSEASAPVTIIPVAPPEIP